MMKIKKPLMTMLGFMMILTNMIMPLPVNAAPLPATLPIAESNGLAMFMDWGYHYADNPQTLVQKLKSGGVTTIYLSGWYANNDYAAFVDRFIQAAHANGVLVYLWLEFPMVSEAFWKAYPAYREKTALGQDAHLDWRYLMALDDPKCFDLAMKTVQTLYTKHDWDGINYAEVYYESPAGTAEPDKMTPFNSAVAQQYAKLHGKDITQFFSKTGELNANTTAQDLEQFLDFRISLLEDLMQKSLRALKPILATNDGDLVLTQIDNFLDPYVARNIGIGPDFYNKISDLYPYQLLIEDPFTLWHLDASRYLQLGDFYKKMNLSQSIGVDINIVTRLHDKTLLPKQAGEELLGLIQQASTAFSFVAIYSANSISQEDLIRIPQKLTQDSQVTSVEKGKYKINAATKIQLRFKENVNQFVVNDKAWGASQGNTLLLPPGTYTVSLSNAKSPLSDVYFTELPVGASQVLKSTYGITLHYKNAGKSFVRVNKLPVRMTLDSQTFKGKVFKDATGKGYWILLPKGAHKLSLYK